MLSLFVLVALRAAPADAGPAAAPRPVSFEYDARQPLEIKDQVIEETPELTLHDLSYASSNQQRVSAYLVVPKGKGPFTPTGGVSIGGRGPFTSTGTPAGWPGVARWSAGG